ncbi:MAG: DUF6146 family protein [Lentimicrobiaceae bacterium]|jgi:hypothetical protein|nr:DUF6146 family protein [Lentimicrobiaceae bacterium]MDY0026329.1 DUF6146 family protein [Lentimicrobium sp.]
MKKLLTAILFMAMFIGFWSCKSTRETTTAEGVETSVQIDSTDYDIIIMDNNFDRWYLTRFSQAQDRSNSYYRSMNNLAVSNWNHYYNTNRYNRVINNHIAYNPAVDYGIEVNRRLYWYFKYIEESYRVPLLR